MDGGCWTIRASGRWTGGYGGVYEFKRHAGNVVHNGNGRAVLNVVVYCDDRTDDNSGAYDNDGSSRARVVVGCDGVSDRENRRMVEQG
jgi:hypothetical protein